MMPQAGTRVSLYFKGDQETSAVAVNCIRSGCGCEEADYRDKGLVTEHEMELRLYQSEMGLATKNGNNLLLNNAKGIELTGTQDFKIVAAGNIRLEGKNIRLEGPGGVNSYQGFLQAKEADSGAGAAQVMAKNVPLVGNGGGEGGCRSFGIGRAGDGAGGGNKSKSRAAGRRRRPGGRLERFGKNLLSCLGT
jgi:hypothetical protein